MSFFRNYLKGRLLKYDSVYKEGINFAKNSCYPAGHYYSPIVSVDEVAERASIIFQDPNKSIPEIDLNVDEQLQILRSFRDIYQNFPYEEDHQDALRFKLNNDFFFATDAVVLYCMLQYLKPGKIIEIGSGYSSSLMLDVSDKAELTFIEPNPERLFGLLNDSDKSRADIIVKKIQDVNLDQFKKLSKGDILFVDSSHVSKTGSDLNWIIFEILPLLNEGVVIHFHDIFYPFEYPKKWIFEGRNWNEAYILRAFLMNNSRYKIKFFNHYMRLFYSDIFNFKSCKSDSGSSLWIEKVAN
jgi:predicted O-methyltransferase YrrM